MCKRGRFVLEVEPPILNQGVCGSNPECNKEIDFKFPALHPVSWATPIVIRLLIVGVKWKEKKIGCVLCMNNLSSTNMRRRIVESQSRNTIRLQY